MSFNILLSLVMMWYNQKVHKVQAGLVPCVLSVSCLKRCGYFVRSLGLFDAARAFHEGQKGQ